MNSGVILQVTTDPRLDPVSDDKPYWELNEEELRIWASEVGGRRTQLTRQLRLLANFVESPTDDNRRLLLTDD